LSFVAAEIAAYKERTMPNDVDEAMPAFAGFLAIQLAFVALVKKGILSTAEAEAILRKAIDAVKAEGAGDRAAELLAGLLEGLSRFQPPSREIGREKSQHQDVRRDF
jgi:hypothetical protein